MQVCSVPDGVTVPDFGDTLTDGRYDMKKDDANIARFIEELKQRLIEMGYTGKLTGNVVRFPIADGYAQYMVAESPKKTVLIHLPIHDAWNIPEAHARGLLKSDIAYMVERDAKFRDLFGSKTG